MAMSQESDNRVFVSQPEGLTPIKITVGGLVGAIVISEYSRPVAAQEVGDESDCSYGEALYWTSDLNRDGQPGPNPSEFNCRLKPGCESYSFIGHSAIAKAMGESMTPEQREQAAQAWRDHGVINACEGDPTPTLGDYQGFLDAAPWFEEFLSENTWIGDELQSNPQYNNKPWAVLYRRIHGGQQPEVTEESELEEVGPEDQDKDPIETEQPEVTEESQESGQSTDQTHVEEDTTPTTKPQDQETTRSTGPETIDGESEESGQSTDQTRVEKDTTPTTKPQDQETTRSTGPETIDGESEESGQSTDQTRVEKDTTPTTKPQVQETTRSTGPETGDSTVEAQATGVHTDTDTTVLPEVLLFGTIGLLALGAIGAGFKPTRRRNR